MTDELMSEIKVPRTDGSIITVVGVGGAGGNAVNHMWIFSITTDRIRRHRWRRRWERWRIS